MKQDDMCHCYILRVLKESTWVFELTDDRQQGKKS